MIKDIIENEDYKNLIQKQIKEIIIYLLEKNQEFSITAKLDNISFEPQLPSVIKNKLPVYSLFVLSNYTYSTITIDDNFMSFEAGFGSENFGSLVKVPIFSIFQVIVDESILYLNPVATVEKFKKDKKTNSMNIFKNNPNNRKFN